MSESSEGGRKFSQGSIGVGVTVGVGVSVGVGVFVLVGVGVGVRVQVAEGEGVRLGSGVDVLPSPKRLKDLLQALMRTTPRRHSTQCRKDGFMFFSIKYLGERSRPFTFAE
jgi:hypothetical protein